MKKALIILLISSLTFIIGCSSEQSKNEQSNNQKSNKQQRQKNKEVTISEQRKKQHDTAQSMELIEVEVSGSRMASPMKPAQMKRASLKKAQFSVAKYEPLHRYIQSAPANTEKYTHKDENNIKLARQEPVSTFSIDVDTASYANVRRLLNEGDLPQHDAVRVEELINYFSYNYPQPKTEPFSVYSEVGPSPFNQDKHLVHIGIQGKQFEQAQRPPANLVFLIDVSGSMNQANKLGLLKNSLKMLTRQLSAQDKVAIVVYAGAAGTVLEPTPGNNNQAIIDALSRLSAGGSTNGSGGIQAAYSLAQQHFVKKGINRVVLATDGDFNVGTVNQQALKNLIEQKRKTGISLSILGFGNGNYNDALMQELAQNGNGNAYYIDTLNEARKVLVEELNATLMTIAKDVKIQLEFNPALVAEYRLIGYETRALNREDFNNDKVDAGDIGAGHTVTAIYEISLTSAKNKSVDELRYKTEAPKRDISKVKSSELAFLRLRYKAPEQSESQLIEIPINISAVKTQFADTSNTFKFSAAVAGYGQLLRGGKYLSTMDLDNVVEVATKAKGNDDFGYKAEFVNMVKLTLALSEPELPQNNNIASNQ